MEDYKNIIIEYKGLQNMVENQTNDLDLIQSKLKTFINNISSLKDDVINIPEIKNGSFGFLDPILKNFVNNIQKDITQFSDIILSPLENFIYSFKFATAKNLTQFNEIKCDLFEEKKILTNKRDTYFNCLNESNKQTKNTKNTFFRKSANNLSIYSELSSSKKDENIYNNAVTENYLQLYQYELNKMNEIIEESNMKYNNIYHEINAINASLKITVRDCLLKFAKTLTDFSKTFNNLSDEIIKKIESLKILNNQEISQSVDKVTSTTDQPRFEKEKLEKTISAEIKDKEKEKEKEKEKNPEKKKLFQFFTKKKSQSINTPPPILNKKSEGDDTFELVSQQRIQNEEHKKDNNELINEIIKKIVGEEELKSKEISNLFNILTIDNKENNKEENLYAKTFLNKIKEYYNHRVISFKNKNNFIHLSNIMNDLCLKHKKNNDIFHLIIEVSQMIKYKNDYIYKIIQKKNEFFSTKTLWLQLIDNDLIVELNKYVDDKLTKKIEDKDKSFIKENEEKDEKNNILERSGINKKITNYRKLNKTQKKELMQFSKEKIISLLSKSISGMCCFLVPQKVIEEIIILYGAKFKFELEIKNYLKNKMIVKNMKVRHIKKLCADKDEKLYNKMIIISSFSKFYPIEKYQNLLKLNKKIYPQLKKNIFLNLFSDKRYESIDSHIKLWKEYLQLDKIKKKMNYHDIKNSLQYSIENANLTETLQEGKNIFLIEKDVLRTLFTQKNKEHINSLKFILICFLFTYPEFGYCQGMNCVASFLYQLLDYNEEETFYFLCGLENNTKYHEIFQDDFETLTKFFIIFEKILNINRPEIYYKFNDNNIVTNSYSSSWFITLFTDNVYIFDKNNPPKFVFFVIERFILEGWSAIFNCGFTLLEYCYEKIMTLEREKLLTYVMNILDNEQIFKNENFEKVKELYLKNSILINEFFIEKLFEITKYEEKNKYLNETINVIGDNEE